MIGIVVPTKTDAYARRLLRSLATCEPGFACRVALVDNGLSEGFRREAAGYGAPVPGAGVVFVDNPDPFVFARAVNLGVAALDPSDDVLILNDDAVFCSPKPIAALEALLDERTGAEDDFGRPSPTVRDVFGVIAPKLEGGVGNPDQNAPLEPSQVLATDKAICFVAALIPRGVWREVGPLDERFDGYGMDDVDYCRRAGAAGYRLAVTGAATVRHVGDPATGDMHGTYGRLPREEHARMYERNQRLYAEKWGDPGRGAVTGGR